jgi:hypothetical protein
VYKTDKELRLEAKLNQFKTKNDAAVMTQYQQLKSLDQALAAVVVGASS